jgi:hypothetical protein
MHSHRRRTGWSQAVAAAGMPRRRTKVFCQFGGDTMDNLNELRQALLAALPAESTTDIVRAQVDRLAELMALAARLRQQALVARRIDIEKLMRLENLVSRLLRSLGLDKPPKPAPMLPWQVLARKAEQS